MITKLKCFFHNYWFCLQLIYKANKFNFFIIMVINLITGSLPFFSMYVMKDILDNISSILGLGEGLAQNPDIWQSAVFNLFIYFFINILIGFIGDFGGKISSLQTQNLLTYITISLMQKSVDIDISYYDIPQKFDDMTRSRQNSHAMHEIVFSTVGTFTAIVNLITALILALQVSLVLVLLSFLSLVPSFLFKKNLEKRRYEFNKGMFREDRQNSYIYSLLFNKQAAKELRLFGMGNRFLKRFLEKDKELFLRRKQFNKKNNFIGILIGLPQTALNVGTQIYIVIKIIERVYSLGDFTYIPGLFGNLTGGIGRIIDNISMYIGYNQKIQDFKTYFMLSESEITAGDQLITSIDQIEFRHVNFTYPGTDRLVLRDISFTIRKGEKTALVGINGSGKTTIIKLLTRFYEPTSGDIFINGINVRAIDTESLRRQISSVFQDYNIYSFTLRENISISNIGFKQEDQLLRDALFFTDFNNEVYERDRNIDVYIGKEFDPNGIELSGGQNQKLAISRAVFRNADTVILDEPTASLDPEAEFKILSFFKKLYKNKTLLMISHRMSNTVMMDHIMVIENGEIIESGSHWQLMKQEGKYAYLFNLQGNKYIAGTKIS